MNLRKYSHNLARHRRGTNSLPPYEVKAIAYRNAKRLIDQPDLWPALDVGCGLGYFVQACLENGIPSVGIDIDPRQLAYAERRIQRHGLNPTLYRADARQLPLEDNRFGFVLSNGMLMMIPFAEMEIYGRILTPDETRAEVSKVLSEMRRVLKSDGRIRIVTFSDKETRERHYYKPEPQELEELGVSVGLLPIQVIYHPRDSRLIEAQFLKPM